MKKFEEKIEEFKNDGYEVKLKDSDFCQFATATKLLKTSSRDPWGNETSSEEFERMVEYEITGYDDGTVECLKVF